MEKFLGKFDLNVLLRNFLSGVVFLWGLHSYFDNLNIYSMDISRLVVLSALNGIIVYSIHRNLPFYYIFELNTCKKAGFDDYAKYKTAVWFKRDDKKFKTIFEGLHEWGSQIHFLFCLSWSLILSALLIFFKYMFCFSICRSSALLDCLMNIGLAIIFFIVGCIGNSNNENVYLFALGNDYQKALNIINKERFKNLKTSKN